MLNLTSAKWFVIAFKINPGIDLTSAKLFVIASKLMLLTQEFSKIVCKINAIDPGIDLTSAKLIIGIQIGWDLHRAAI